MNSALKVLHDMTRQGSNLTSYHSGTLGLCLQARFYLCWFLPGSSMQRGLSESSKFAPAIPLPTTLLTITPYSLLPYLSLPTGANLT